MKARLESETLVSSFNFDTYLQYSESKYDKSFRHLENSLHKHQHSKNCRRENCSEVTIHFHQQTKRWLCQYQIRLAIALVQGPL